MKEMVLRLIREEEGQGLAEYALILVLVSVAAILALGLLSGWIQDVFERISDEDIPS